MKSFSRYMSEATEQKNIHIEHLEDLLLDGEAAFALSVLSEFGIMLANGEHSHTMHVSTKWDGSPSIIFGPDPATGKGFFVSTKSLFNKAPKLAHSHEEIDAHFPATVAKFLHVALDRLPALQPAAVLQADVLFIRDTVKPQMVEDVYCYTFQPNTLVYAVPVSSAYGSRIQQAELGIAVHTIYVGTGTALGEYSAQPVNDSTFAALRPLPDVFVVNAQDAELGHVRFKEDAESDFTLAMERAFKCAQNVSAPTYEAIADMRAPLARFLNYVVREGLALNAIEYVEGFYSYLSERQAKNVDLAGARQGLEQWFRLYIAIGRAKTVVLRTMEQAQSEFGTFVKVNGDLKSTGPEGFVCTVGHKTVKLVDRNEFSRLNFAR